MADVAEVLPHLAQIFLLAIQGEIHQALDGVHLGEGPGREAQDLGAGLLLSAEHGQQCPGHLPGTVAEDVPLQDGQDLSVHGLHGDAGRPDGEIILPHIFAEGLAGNKTVLSVHDHPIKIPGTRKPGSVPFP